MSCPLCKAPTDKAYRPFCSRACADRDLLNWIDGRYSVPSTDPEDIEKALEESQSVTPRDRLN